RSREAVKQTGGPAGSRQRAVETSSKMEVVKQREAPSVNMQTDMREGEAVREADREKMDQHKDTHEIQIIHRLDKQLARRRQTGELTRTWRLTDKKACRQAGGQAGWRKSL
ncbi:hypothetical protein GBF38_016334, partial [Nibea albiflora]